MINLKFGLVVLPGWWWGVCVEKAGRKAQLC